MSSIREYWSGKALLLTGATGLMGRALAAKILQDLPEIGRLYVLIRPRTTRPGKLLSVEERLWEDLLGSNAFSALQMELGSQFLTRMNEKVVAVSGDLSQDGMGLDPQTRSLLRNELDVIINCAAAVTFDAPLDTALHINTLGPLRILDLAKECAKQVTMAHVSTCYVNSSREGLVKEEPMAPNLAMAPSRGTPYDVDTEVRALTRLVERVKAQSRLHWRRPLLEWEMRRQSKPQGVSPQEKKRSVRDRLRREWVDRRLVLEGMRWAKYRGWNDTYTFTKGMGEQLLVRYCDEVPTIILRPSIIESAMESPAPGWLEGMRMIDPLIVAYGRNQLPDFPGDPETVLDIIPVDMVVNALLAAVSEAPTEPGSPKVYQVATGTENPITMGTFVEVVQQYFRSHSLTGRGSPNSLLPRVTFPTAKQFIRRIKYKYMLPIRGVQFITTLLPIPGWRGKVLERCRSRLVGLRKLLYYARIFGPYGAVRCQYDSQQVRRLYESLTAEDRDVFNFDTQRINWQHYIEDIHIPGIRRYVLGISPRPVAPEVPNLLETAQKVPSGDTVADGQSFEDREDLKEDTNRATPPIRRRKKESVEHWLGLGRWNWVPRALARWLFGLGFHHYLGLTCEGVEHVPTSGSYIVASNHNSHVDTTALLVLLGKDTRYLHPVAARDYFFSTPLRAWASRLFLGAVPFDRDGGPIESLGLATELLRRNHSLIFFPEGGRSPDGKMHAFRRGIGVLALESGAAVLPVHIQGSFQALPKGSFLLRRHPIRVRIGPPIDVQPYRDLMNGEPMHELTRRISEDAQKAVEALS
jgi:1-acyl-sn-glycerol-3-phosphate acyltransferase